MSKLQGILSTKEGQDQLANIASMLNKQNEPEKPQPPPQENQGGFDFSSLAAMLSGGNNNGGNNGQQAESTAPPIDMNMIMMMQKLMSSVNTNDKNTQLLLALKPHFSEERQAKVDKAMTMMRLISMLPMLKESGILKGIL